MAKKIKKDFDKEKMYSKIMPSMVTPPPQQEHFGRGSEEEEEKNDLKQQYVLRNFIEDIVLDKLDHTITMLRCCECELCKKDVMAQALNELPTSYIAIEPDDLEETIKTLRSNYEVKVASALIKAVQNVKLHPRH